MTLADVFNVGSELTAPDGPDGTPGAVYTLRKPTLEEQGLFQRWLETRAHQAVDRSEASAGDKDRRHHLIDVDAGLGKYEYDGAIAMEALWTASGMAKILTIVCREQGLTDEGAEQLFMANARQVAARVLMKAAEDPKALRPLLGALGFPMNWFEESDSSSSPSSTHPSTEPSPNSADSPTIKSCSSTPSREAPMG